MVEYPKLKLRKIKYDSPSGYVNIGKYVPPFEEVDKGYGFKGILIEDFDSGKLQCHICGKWLEQMPTHLRLIHNLTANEYKTRFGLSISTALKSKKMRLKQSEVMIKMRKSNIKYRYCFTKRNNYAGNRKNKPKSLETRNKYGVCDLQVMDRIVNLAKELGKTPTLIDVKEKYGAGMVFLLNKRYGSYIRLCKSLELEPNFSNFNPKYNREYFIEKALSSEATIRIMSVNEQRAFYRYFKGVKELREVIKKIKKNG